MLLSYNFFYRKIIRENICEGAFLLSQARKVCNCLFYEQWGETKEKNQEQRHKT